MLIYDFKKEDKKYSLQKQSSKKVAVSSAWVKWVRFILQFIVQIAISEISSVIQIPGVSMLFEFLLSTLSDLLFNLFFNGFKIDWQEFLISFGFNLTFAFVRVGKLVYLTRKQNKIFSLADNVIENNKELKKELLKNAKSVEKHFGYFENNLDDIYDPNTGAIIQKDLTNYKIFEEENKNLLSNISKTLNLEKTGSILNFKTTAQQSKALFTATSKAIQNTKSGIMKVKSVVDSFVSPRRAGRKLADLIFKKPKRLFNAQIRKWYKTVADSRIIKWTEKSIEEQAKYIPLDSSWIDSIKIVRANGLWNVSQVNCVVKFIPEATNRKPPVLLWGKDFDLILKFLNESPGKHYLKHFAWGWKIGKILRKQALFIKHINIPIFSTFVSNLAYVQKTLMYFSKTLKDKEFGWTKNDGWKEFTKGIFENSYTGWRFPGSNKIISLGRAIHKQNASYFTNAAVRFVQSRAYKNKLKKSLSNYSFTRPPRQKIRRKK